MPTQVCSNDSAQIKSDLKCIDNHELCKNLFRMNLNSFRWIFKNHEKWIDSFRLISSSIVIIRFYRIIKHHGLDKKAIALVQQADRKFTKMKFFVDTKAISLQEPNRSFT